MSMVSNCLLLFTAAIVISFSSCSQKEANNSSRDSEIEKLIFIPDIFENDTFTTAHLYKLSYNLEKFSLIIEDIADEFESIGIDKLKKPTVREKLRLMRIILPNTQNIFDIISNIDTLSATSESIKDTLPNDKLQEFIAFEEFYNEKIETLYNRFNDYLKTVEN